MIKEPNAIEVLRTEIIELKLTRPYDPVIAGKLLKLDQLIEDAS